MRSSCPVCTNKNSNIAITRRKFVPILQNITFDNSHSARTFSGGSLEILQCRECSFVWNKDFDDELIDYDYNYNNDVSNSTYYRKHLKSMAKRAINLVNDGEPINLVEIGCGDGSFIKLIEGMVGSRLESVVGFDPSFNKNICDLPKKTKIYKEYFDSDSIDKLELSTNLVVSRHTIEHISNPRTFAKSLSEVILRYNANLAIETPDVDWIFRNMAFQDFFYEHCSLFNSVSIARLFSEQGLCCSSKDVYDGQYMWSEIRAKSSINERKNRKNVTPLEEKYFDREAEFVKKWVDLIRGRREYGPVALWGGASKGVTFSLILDAVDSTLIDGVIDLNNQKQGRYLPSTGLQIISPEQAQKAKINTIIIMNPNYYNEIRTQVRMMGWAPEILTL